MPKSTAAANRYLLLLLNNTAWPNVGNAAGLAGSSGAGSPGNLYMSLHTASPGNGGTQASSEATYPGYGRVAIVRTASGFTVTGGSGTNVADVVFPQASGGPETETHFALGLAASGAGELLYHAPLDASLVVNNLISPRFAAGALNITET